MWNLLTEALLNVSRSDGTRVVSLPELLVALSRDEVDELPAVRPHQEHAWYAFLVQIAAMAAHRAGSDPARVDRGRLADAPPRPRGRR
jgi:CRISPR system Cascade subunit CasA